MTLIINKISTPLRINNSVGQSCKNDQSDVALIQILVSEKLKYEFSDCLMPDGKCGNKTINAIAQVQFAMGKRDIDGIILPNSQELRFLLSNRGIGLYTYNQNERETKHTKADPFKVCEMIRGLWPDLSARGRRTLAAQFMHETNNCKDFYNWNLGNIKANSSTPHMYLSRTWENIKDNRVEEIIRNGKGLVRIATKEEERTKQKTPPAGHIMLWFWPPHPMSRFRAYSTLQDGIDHWIKRHQKIMINNPEYIKVLEACDCDKTANLLKNNRYYTGKEEDYGRAMKKALQSIDRYMGELELVMDGSASA